jgi:hypothetical protein
LEIWTVDIGRPRQVGGGVEAVRSAREQRPVVRSAVAVFTVAALAVGASVVDRRSSSPEAAEAATKSSPAPPKLRRLDYFTAVYARRLQAYTRRARTVKFKIETPLGRVSRVKAKGCRGASWCEVDNRSSPGKRATRLIRDALNHGATARVRVAARNNGGYRRATARLNASTCDFVGDPEERWTCTVRLR